MSRTLKFISIGLLVIISVAIGYFYLSPDNKINGLYLIPSDAMYILDSDDPISDWESLSNNEVWGFLKGHPSFVNISKDADYLDELLADNKILFKLFGSRKFLMSAHVTRPGDYSFLFAIDLKKSAKTGVLYTALEKALKSSGFDVTRRKYKGYEFLESMDEFKEILTLCKIQNFLICSYSSALVEKSVEAFENPEIARDIYFQDVFKKVSENGVARLFIQYKMLDKLMACYMAQPDEMINDLSRTLRYSALDLIVDQTEWRVRGVSNINDEMESYLLALMRSGQSENRVHEILSNRTAWYLSFNFSSIDEFYTEVNTALKPNKESYDEFMASQNKLEKILGISVKKYLLDWVSDEASIAQMRNNHYAKRTDNLVVCLRTNDMERATTSLNEIADRVKKRTPGKFKKILYRNYNIQYLDIKGFFRTFFGKAFQKLEKPYYTTIGDYVVFSNNPITIIGLIEDYENERTLSSNAAHINYRKKADGESSLTVYISPENTHPLLSKYAKSQTSSTLAKSKAYFDAFESFGFQFNSQGSLIKTLAYLKMKVDETETEEQILEQELVSKFDKYATSNAEIDSMFVLQMIEDGIYKKYYPDAQKIEIKAETKKGVMHGKYEEFYQNGILRVKGKYRSGKKVGIWKYYDSRGDQRDKERF
jgi:antitoxin component YwqK of YwqJK toxin-antitoxin module